MVANRSHPQQQTADRPHLHHPDDNQTSAAPKATKEAKVTTVPKGTKATRPSSVFTALLAIAAIATMTVGGTLEARAQGKTAGPAIPKAPASAQATPVPNPTSAVAKPTTISEPVQTPKPRRAVAKVQRPKAKAVAKTSRAVSSSRTAKAGAKAKAVSTGGGASSTGGFGQGASGTRVSAVQERLASLRYDVTSTDGKYGDQLYQAVMAFQKVNGLSRTGRVNTQTLTALDTATEPTPLIPTGGADRIEVDLQKQYLALYKAGSLYRLLSISSGSGKAFCVYDPETKKTECDKAVTPGGSFRVRSRWVGWRESKLGLLYNPLYFNGGIAIHGAPSVPATPASHGCVRIPMISSQWFPEQVTDGTPVYVFGGEEGAPVPLKSKAPADAKVAPTTAPSNTLATIPPAGVGPTTTKLGSAAPQATLPTLASAPTTLAPTTTPATTTTTGLARLLTPVGTPSAPVTAAPGATVPGSTTTAGVVITGTVNGGSTTTTTTRPATAIVTSVGATPIATTVGASVVTTTTTIKP